MKSQIETDDKLLALEIERQYTKQEILRFYCNQIYMGHGRYGLEAASRYYFGIPARELSRGQAATLAGLLQRPEALSPRRHPERAVERRNYVLRRMVEVGSLTAEEASATIATPLDAPPPDGQGNLAPYFVEEVRRWLQARYGSSSLYTGGLTVRTTLDPGLQEIANRAVEMGLRELDKRQGWRGVSERAPEGEAAAIFARLEAEARGQYEILARKGQGLQQIITSCGGAHEAFQMLPWVSFVCDTYAAVLIERDEAQKGLLLLMEADALEGDDRERSVRNAWRAVAYARRRDTALAEYWLGIARRRGLEIGPPPALIEKAEALLAECGTTAAP